MYFKKKYELWNRMYCACMLAYPACTHNSEFRRFAAEFRRYLPRNSGMCPITTSHLAFFPLTLSNIRAWQAR